MLTRVDDCKMKSSGTSSTKKGLQRSCVLATEDYRTWVLLPVTVPDLRSPSLTLQGPDKDGGTEMGV